VVAQLLATLARSRGQSNPLKMHGIFDAFAGITIDTLWHLTIMVNISPLWCILMKQDIKSGKSRRLTITLAKGQRGRIEAIARRRHTSAATVIRWAVDKYLAAKTVKARAAR
jgi:hypothetical protein